MTSTPALLAILGPTSSGKSSLAIYLAKQFSGEVINCDSLQMYKGFDIGTGKLTREEQEGIPHYLIDLLEPRETFTAGSYARLAAETISSVAARGKLPIIAGGTGFYFRALIAGLFPGPPGNPALRQRLQTRAGEKGRDYLHRLLRRLDPLAADRIHPNDNPKLIRAIEVCLETRRPISEMFQEGRQALEGYRVVKIGLNPPRSELYERINRQTRTFFERGLVEEVRGILAQGVPRNAHPFGSHGYREALDYLDGKIGIEDAIRLAQDKSRQYAKRQITWFRKEPGVRWFSGFGTSTEVQKEAGSYLSEQLMESATSG